jgi:hypothetical protein
MVRTAFIATALLDVRHEVINVLIVMCDALACSSGYALQHSHQPQVQKSEGM